MPVTTSCSQLFSCWLQLPWSPVLELLPPTNFLSGVFHSRPQGLDESPLTL